MRRDGLVLHCRLLQRRRLRLSRQRRGRCLLGGGGGTVGGGKVKGDQARAHRGGWGVREGVVRGVEQRQHLRPVLQDGAKQRHEPVRRCIQPPLASAAEWQEPEPPVQPRKVQWHPRWASRRRPGLVLEPVWPPVLPISRSLFISNYYSYSPYTIELNGYGMSSVVRNHTRSPRSRRVTGPCRRHYRTGGGSRPRPGGLPASPDRYVSSARRPARARPAVAARPARCRLPTAHSLDRALDRQARLLVRRGLTAGESAPYCAESLGSACVRTPSACVHSVRRPGRTSDRYRFV
jgi:hypothetical protein